MGHRRCVGRTALTTTLCAAAGLWAAAPALAADRAYELITPPDSQGRMEAGGGFSTPSGDAVFFQTPDLLEPADFNGPEAYDGFRSVRSASGWDLTWATGPRLDAGTYGGRVAYATDDAKRWVTWTEDGLVPEDAWHHSTDSYVWDGGHTWVTPGVRTNGFDGSRRVLAATPDLRYLVFTSRNQLVAEDTNAVPDVYQWTPGGLRLMATGPQGSQAFASGEGSSINVVPTNLQSSDGSQVFFHAADRLAPGDTDSATDVYVRDGGSTILVSPTKRTVPATPQPAYLAGATPDASTVWIGTTEPLTDDDTDSAFDIYRYVRATDTLTLESTGSAPSGTAASRPLAVSPDGSTLFFSTTNGLEPTDTDGGLSLYRRAAGATTYIAPLVSTDNTAQRRVSTPNAAQRALRVSDDGTIAAFVTAAAARGTDTDSQPDVYRWSVADGLTHVSVTPTGGNLAFPAVIGNVEQLSPSYTDTWTPNAVTGRVMSRDGQLLLFESAEALVPADTDGGQLDVYAWTAAGGVELISPAGSAPFPARYMDNSEDGSSVFFVTGEQIFPYDVDGGARDVYVSRVGGGLPGPVSDEDPNLGAAPAPAGPAGPPPVPPVASTAPTPAPSSPLPPTPQQDDPIERPASVATDTRRLTLEDGEIAVEIEVSGPGTLHARLVRRGKTIASHRGPVSESGETTSTLRLNARGRKALRKGDVRARLVVAFTPESGDRVRISRRVRVSEAEERQSGKTTRQVAAQKENR